MTDPLSVFAPELVQAIQRLVDERVKAALAELEPSNGSPWLRIEDAAAYLGVSPRTITRLVEQAVSVPPASVVAGSCTATISTRR